MVTDFFSNVYKFIVLIATLSSTPFVASALGEKGNIKLSRSEQRRHFPDYEPKASVRASEFA